MAKVFYCKHIPFKGYFATMLFGFIIFRSEYKNISATLKERIMRHEIQHRNQFLYTGILPFYPLYILEYLIRLIWFRNKDTAYDTVSFEREAKEFQKGKLYTGTRFWRYLF